MKVLARRFNLMRIVLLTLAIGSTLTFFIRDAHSTRPPSPGTSGLLATILVGDRPDGIAYNPSNQMVYVTVLGSAYNSPGKVAVIDGRSNKVVTNLLVDSNPEAVLYDPANQQVYVTSSGSVSVINNANQIIKTIGVPFGAVALAYDSVNNDIYVASVYSNVVSVIDPSKNSVVASIAVNSPSNLVYDSSRNYVYASSDYAQTVTVIDGSKNRVVTSIQACSYCDPEGLALYPATGNVYVANFGTGSVSVISDLTNSIVSRLVVGNNPFGVLYDPANQQIYVANYSSRTVSVIDPSTNSVVSTVSAGNGPWNLAYDNANNDVYVTDFGSNTVSVIAG